MTQAENIPTASPPLGAESTDLDFSKWLWQQLGKCKWIVARGNKKLRKQGYDRFFTQKRFRALKIAYEKEQIPMGEESQHLTEPNADLAEKRRRTPAGMAFWAGTGPANKTCRECELWKYEPRDGYMSGSGLLKESPCEKYARMMNILAGPKLPYYTPSCKYFEPAVTERSIEKRA